VSKVMGYSPRKDEESNPVLKDFVKAFRGYKAKSRLKPMKPNLLDYMVLIGIAFGFLFIFLSFYAGRTFGIVGSIIIAIAFLSEILSITLR
jgi:hypothetical protein